MELAPVRCTSWVPGSKYGAARVRFRTEYCRRKVLVQNVQENSIGYINFSKDLFYPGGIGRQIMLLVRLNKGLLQKIPSYLRACVRARVCVCVCACACAFYITYMY